MTSQLAQLFEDKRLIGRIKNRLPYLFQIAELESSRAGKIGMEVGSVREKILIALLIYKFGDKNVETKLPITEPETDVKLFGYPISIKTITGIGGVKIIWTVDAQKSKEFCDTYAPKCDTLLANIQWDRTGHLYYIPLEVQKRIFRNLGKERYLRLPKAGTNPRGVEIGREALSTLIKDPDTKSIEIEWRRSKIEYDPYSRWLDYWEKEEMPSDEN
jgi:hypothetical protein